MKREMKREMKLVYLFLLCYVFQIAISCQIAFRLENIQDYYAASTQMEVINAFKQQEIPLTIGLIANYFGNDATLVSFIRAAAANTTLIEVASNGYLHENFQSLDFATQSNLLTLSRAQIQTTMGSGIPPVETFIAPFGTFDDNTLSALVANNFTTISADAYGSTCPIIDNRYPSIRQFHRRASTATFDANLSPVSASITFAQISAQLALCSGWSVVMMHPYEFFNASSGAPNLQMIDQLNVLLTTAKSLQCRFSLLKELLILPVTNDTANVTCDPSTSGACVPSSSSGAVSSSSGPSDPGSSSSGSSDAGSSSSGSSAAGSSSSGSSDAGSSSSGSSAAGSSSSGSSDAGSGSSGPSSSSLNSLVNSNVLSSNTASDSSSGSVSGSSENSLSGGSISSSSASSSSTGSSSSGTRVCRIGFRLDDIQDYYTNNAQMAVINTFLQFQIPLTIGIISDFFGEDTTLVSFIRTAIANVSLIEVASHGYQHENFNGLPLDTQTNLLQQSKQQITQKLGSALVTPITTFITPYDEYDSNTLTAMATNNLQTISAGDFVEPCSALTNTAPIYKYPRGASTSTQDADLLPVPASVTFAQVLAQLDTCGFSVVMLHPYEFYDASTAGLNSTTFDQLNTLLVNLRNLNCDMRLLKDMHL